MTFLQNTIIHRPLRLTAALCILYLVLSFVPGTLIAEEQTTISPLPRIHAFQPGEILTYDISWSKIITAGTAVMEVKSETILDGRKFFRFIVTGRSTGLVDKLYRVNDVAQSVFDPQIMQSLTYDLSENYGKKKRHRDLAFDHVSNTVVSRLNNDPPETFAIPEQVQDVLSSLYYIRTMEEFGTGKTFVFDVYDGGKIWSVEVYTLGREKVKTSAGNFDTVKIKTYPKYKGVFMDKGEVFIWLTDDERKVPVLMKSRLAVGSFVFTLTEMKPGNDMQSLSQ